MVTTKRGLGKGLSALLPNAASSISSGESRMALASGKTVLNVSPDEIVPNPRQPRHTFAEEAIRELAASIKEHGILQPLLTRLIDGRYELIAGERRLRAAKILKLDTVPIIVKSISNEKSLELAIIENIQREDLDPLDEAESYMLLMKEFGLTQEMVSQKVGKSRSAIANSLRLMELPREVKDSLRKGEITSGHARAILSLEKVTEQLKMLNDIKKNGLNVRSVESAASASKQGSNNRKAAKEKTITPVMNEVQDKISSYFGTKVTIHGNESKGKIEIAYYSPVDLERIIEVLK